MMKLDDESGYLEPLIVLVPPVINIRKLYEKSVSESLPGSC